MSSKIGAHSNWLGATSFVAGLQRNTQFIGLRLQVSMKPSTRSGMDPEVVVLELLAFAEEWPDRVTTGNGQVGTRLRGIDSREIFLFNAQRGMTFVTSLSSAANIDSGFVEARARLSTGGFASRCPPRVGNENGRNAGDLTAGVP